MSICNTTSTIRSLFLGVFLGLNLSHTSLAGELPIPPQDLGQVVAGQRVFNLVMQAGTMPFVPGAPLTNTYGYNGNYLGPTLRMTRGEEVLLNVTNNLSIDSTTHWHGFHIPTAMDGGPWQIIKAGGDTWSPFFTVDNPAATFWYHPHIMPANAFGGAQDPDSTSGQVYRGLAGLIFVDDENSAALALPKQYGIDDIPLIIQDREFNQITGEFIEFPLGSAPGEQLVILRKGKTILANGEIDAVFTTSPQLIRFHILNGSNARLYNLGFSDDRSFMQIASDGGLLQAPVPISRVLLAPGERIEIVVDLSGDQGNSNLSLRSFASELGSNYVPNVLADDYDRSDFDILGFAVSKPVTADAVFELPETLAAVTRIAETEAVNLGAPRPFLMGIAGGAGMSINGVKMDIDVINETILLGDTEIWELENPAQQFHPIHIHGNAFQILTRDADSAGPGIPTPPPANEMGWKDVVIVAPGETVRLIKRFIDFADPVVPYMYHCHILDHEDAGMMGQFLVVAPLETEQPACAVFANNRLSFDVDAGDSGSASVALDLISSDPYVFQLDPNSVATLTDAQCAIFSDGILTIPTLNAVGIGTFTNLEFELTDADSMRFTLLGL